MEPSIHMFARGDKNPLTYYRQVPDVKRLIVVWVHTGPDRREGVDRSRAQ